MLKSYKYRLYPNNQQQELINKTIGCCRYIFNNYLAKKIELYKTEKKSITYNQCANDLKQLKESIEWLNEVDSISLQQTLKDLDRAYQNFFRRIKKGEKFGFPKFKSKKNPKQSYRTMNIKGFQTLHFSRGNFAWDTKVGKPLFLFFKETYQLP